MIDLPSWLSRRNGNFLGFLACAGMMSYALFVQYVLQLQPCPLCILQRVSVISAGLLFLVAFLQNPRDLGARIYGVLIDVAALGGILVASRHIWVIAQPPGTVATCGASLEYMMDVLPLQEVLGKVLTGSGECAKIDWMFLGLNMPTWVLMCLVGIGFWGVLVNWFAPAAKR